MPSSHTDISFSNARLNGITANKLNLLVDDLSTAIDSASGTPGVPGTGGLVDPGVWTPLPLGSGWSAPSQADYRKEVNDAVRIVYFRGMIQAAYAAMGTTAFTVPATVRPAWTRSRILAGAQNTGNPIDVACYIVNVATSGVGTIFFLGGGPFVWADPSKTQQIFLDGLSYSL